MALFKFGKKKDAEKPACCCSSCDCSQGCGEAKSSVKILGGGCEKCNQLEKATVEALGMLGMDTAVEHVTDFAVIAQYGVMTTPALVVDEKVLCYGKVLKTAEVVELLKKARA